MRAKSKKMKDLSNLKLTLIEDKGYDVKELEVKLGSELYSAFNRWFAGKTGFISADGKFCVFDYDFELWVKLRNKITQTH